VPKSPATAAYAVQAQREWLLSHFRADVDLCAPHLEPATMHTGCDRLEPAARCWSCGKLLPFMLLHVGQVDPRYGTRRTNIRPACIRHRG
jgi:hypothetical protein